MSDDLIPIQNMIYEIRGQRVMLDSDLAVLYEVETKRLNEAVRRNIKRFPAEFMFQLTESEFTSLRSQIATSNEGRGGRRYFPFAFTEHGILMLSSVLNSNKAIEINIHIMKIFVQMRNYALEQPSKMIKIDALNDKFDAKFDSLKDEVTNVKLVVGDLKSEIKILSNKFDGIEADVKEVKDRVAKVEETQIQHIAETKIKVETVKEQVEKTTTTTENNSVRVNKIEIETKNVLDKMLNSLTPKTTVL